MRLFLAIPLSAEVDDHVKKLQAKLSQKIFRIPAGAEHLTIKFLSEVAEDKVDAIKAAMETINAEEFELSLSATSAFPNWHDPRVIWVGVTPEEPVRTLQKKVEAALADLFPKDDKFHPHITLARVKDTVDQATVKLIKELTVEPITFNAEKLVLYSSTLTRTGAKHTAMAEIPLR